MLPYIILLLISIICLFFPEKKWAKVLSLGSLFIVSAFRGENVGTDTFGYLHDFRIDYESSLEMIGGHAELITNGFVKLNNSLGLSGRNVLIFFAFITIGSIPVISKRLGISPVFLCFFFLTGQFIISLNICRQVAATMIVALATTYIYEKGTKKSLLFFLYIILATGIHSTSIVFSVFYLMRFCRIRYRMVALLVSVSILLGCCGIIDFSSFLSSLMEHSGSYAHSYLDIFESNDAYISVLGYVVPIIIVLVELYLLKFIDGRTSSIYMLALCVPFFFMGSDTIVNRMLSIFDVLSKFIIAINMGNYNRKGKFSYQLSYFMIIPLVYLFFRSLNPEILPYYFGF